MNMLGIEYQQGGVNHFAINIIIQIIIIIVIIIIIKLRKVKMSRLNPPLS